MLRFILDNRAVFALLIATAVGAWGLHTFPVQVDNPFLALIAARRPHVFQVLTYGYATLWFTTPYLLASMLTSFVTIAVFRTVPSAVYRDLPPYPEPEQRPDLMLVLGETHDATKPERSPEPTWLTIPERGLYTGIMVVGAVGTGKTSACMYPYVDQLLRWRANEPDHKIGGLVMEVKGDFCGQVRTILSRAGREGDYVEVGLNSGTCYNPLHNDLDPYAVAYALASLVNNLFGHSREPFWQQAYTDLLKFVIALRRITVGYTTLSEVYRYIIEEKQIHENIQSLTAQFKRPVDMVVVPDQEYGLHVRDAPWTLWARLDNASMAHPYEAELEIYLADHGVPFEVRTVQPEVIAADRRHRLEAINRWYYNAWVRIDQKVRSSIIEGAVVFLSLFDENPEVHRAFCPPRSAYAKPPEPGEPRPLPPIEDLLETGHVLGLNFPVALNPALARGLGVMLKLDFQRAVLQRIPRMSAHPERTWRDMIFVADEYHAFATVGETDPTGDERAFALSRQARLIPIVATQSLSSLRSALGGDDSWHTLLQCFRTKLFLATSDEFTARMAAELCGKKDRLKMRYTLAEADQGVHISWLTGRAAAPTQTLSASKSYSLESDYVFQPGVFTELQNAQAVALPYDGLNPLPPQFCYLKPYYLDVRQSYFDHLERGAL